MASDLDWIVMKWCLEKDGRRGYETAHGLAKDVRRHLDEEAVEAHPPGWLYLFQKPVRRYRTGFAPAAALPLALAAGLTGVLWQWSAPWRSKNRRRKTETAP